MVGRVETDRVETSPPETPSTPTQELPPEIQSLIQGLEAHRQEVGKLIAELKDHYEVLPTEEDPNFDQKKENRRKIINASAKLVKSAYSVQHLVNSLSSS